MLPFPIKLRPGVSPYKQVVYAATKAVVSGELLPGSPFPSVRILSQELKINPNTAQKAVAELVRDGLLEMRPGVGSVVATWGPATPAERRELVGGELERLLVEAKRLGLTLSELQNAVAMSWRSLFESRDSAECEPSSAAAS
jgi:DNA-binding transcriptional regulator YhcF (GntR family)